LPEPVVILIIAGNPDGCGDTLESLTDVARSGTLSKIATYVVQLGADFDLNPVAKAGSSGPVYLIDSGDVADGLYQVLYDIVTPNLGNTFPVMRSPDLAHPVDPSRTVITMPYGDGTVFVQGLVPHLNSKAECSANVNGGWYYDTDPTHLVLCPCTQALSDNGISGFVYCQ